MWYDYRHVIITMSHLVFLLITQLQDILRHGGYWVIGIVSVAEALPLIGSIIPGHTIVIFGGFFAHLGILNVYAVMFWAAVGALVGDVTAYLLGRKYGFSLISNWGQYFLIKPEHIEKARTALQTHSGKTIILGRFSPITRAFIPFLAGTSGLHIKKFWLYDSIGCILWSVLSVAVGYVFGASYQIITQALGRFTTIGIILVLLISFAYYFINSRRHIFVKYDFHLLLVCLTSLYFFFQTVQDVVSDHPFMVQLDVTFNLVMAHHIKPFLVDIAKIVSDVFSPTTFGILAVGFLIWWIYKKHWQNVYVMIAAYPVGLMFGYLLKISVGRARPINMLIHETDFSFPSTHALAAALFCTLAVYFLVRYINNRHLRELFILGSILLVVLVCASRVYLNVHWFSDVVAGSMFGIFWTTCAILIVRYTEGLIRGRGAKKIK